MQTLPTFRELLKGQEELPEKLRDLCVLLHFGQPIRDRDSSEFYRIHLTRDLVRGRAEEQFYLAEIFQPDRGRAAMSCPNCGQRMARVSLYYHRCMNRRCRLCGKLANNSPVRGVIRVLVFPDFVVETAEEQITTLGMRWSRPVEWIRAALLVLDRRYDPLVLAAVKRTAADLCSSKGWKLL